MINSTTKPLTVPLNTFKRTKILATIGPATDSYEAILALLTAGVNGFRLNFSHGTYEEREQQIKWIRKASLEYGKPVAIVEDLQGPEIRLGNFDGIIPVQAGQELVLAYNEEYQEGGPLPIQSDLSKTVERGQRLLFNDGKIRSQITGVREGKIYVRAENEGVLTKRKSINLPDIDFRGEIITAKDRKDVMFGAAHNDDIDYLAMSFIQTAQDVENMRKLMKNAGLNAKIIAKIETRSAIDNLEEIVKASDGVMVARGDLAAEVSFERVPVIQRQIIGYCLRYEKLSIVATQMLASMVDAIEPTRAEVSDVATAVIIGADCVMLSEETAAGRYPVEAVQVMKRVILYTQENTPLKAEFAPTHEYSLQEAIAAGVITLADQIKADAIVAETKSGATAEVIASFRPAIPLIAVTSLSKTAQQLALYYGMKTFVRPDSKYAASKLTDWLLETQIFHASDVIVSVSGKYPGQIGGTDTIKVRRLE
jgi:pyruvate kinase